MIKQRFNSICHVYGRGISNYNRNNIYLIMFKTNKIKINYYMISYKDEYT